MSVFCCEAIAVINNDIVAIAFVAVYCLDDFSVGFDLNFVTGATS